MRVRALRSFSARWRGQSYHANGGQVVEIPDTLGVALGPLVQVMDEGETAVLPAAKARSTIAEPVTAIKGIGPKTARELKALGIETAPELAAAEDLPEKLARWQEAAREYLRTGGAG